MKYVQKLIALLLAVTLFSLTGVTSQAAVSAEGLTRGETAQMLVDAAQDYQPGIEINDVLMGYPNGERDEDAAVTRAQALVMLSRAFGDLPTPTGAYARSAFPAESFTDVPIWAAPLLSDVLSAGIVAGTATGSLSPNAPITEKQLKLLIQRVYALEGTNEKDDFYSTVNKEWLESAEIPAGEMINGALYGLTTEVNDQLASLIVEIAGKPQKTGTAEARIAALYQSVMNTEGREKEGVAPIQTYLDAIENANTLDDLIAADCLMQKELGFSVLLGYNLTPDMKDSNRYVVVFSSLNATMDKTFYSAGTESQFASYMNYLTETFMLSGLDETTAKEKAQQVYDTEKVISAATLNPQDRSNVDLIYNIFTTEELSGLFPNVDLKAVFAASGLQPTERIMVMDVGGLKAAAGYFSEEHLGDLKAIARFSLLSNTGGCFQQGFQNASQEFYADYYGIEGRQSTEQIAAQQVQALLSDYLSRAYAETYFTAAAKADVESMVAEIVDVYKERILAQDWMSDITKQKAIKKLDAMGVKVGYPDSWETPLDHAELKTPSEGGTFFSNVIAIQKAQWTELLSRQNKGVDRGEWALPVYIVNACYSATGNDITFPAAILQTPMYDLKATREENLGGIGYIIAHEITHAFDNNGAKFDENGNASDWWTAEDYAAFQKKCEAVADWYEGIESAPGIACNGSLTLSENVADLGSAACVTEIVSRMDRPDYETLFRAIAKTWASTSSREVQQYLITQDVHAPDKLRANRVLQTLPEFYETFEITESDGMWVETEKRVSVW